MNEKAREKLRERKREFGNLVMRFWCTHDGISLKDMSEYLSGASMFQGEFWEDFSEMVAALEKQVEVEELRKCANDERSRSN